MIRWRIWCLGLIAAALDWEDVDLGSPQVGWRERVEQLPYGIVLDGGRVKVVEKG